MALQQTTTTVSRPWADLVLPDALTRMRAMLSHEEKQYLTWVAAERFEGWGAIVDLGPWLGASSVALAEGVRRQGKRDKVFSFDLFKWDPRYMEPLAQEGLKLDDDFLPVFVREVGDYIKWIEPERTDLMAATWDRGPIEILFVDAAKTWELTNAILRTFGPHLQPGRSRVVLQDFRHDTCYWLPLIFDSRPDIWQQTEAVDTGQTVTFMPLKALNGPAGIHPDYDEASFPLASADALFRSRIARELPEGRQWLRRGMYKKYLIDDGPADILAAMRDQILRDGIQDDELAVLENLELALLPKGWRAFGAGDYAAAKRCAERCISVGRARFPYAVGLLAMAAIRLGDLDEARTCIDELAGRHPDPALPLMYRAELAMAEGRHRAAESDASAVLASGREEQWLVDYATSLLQQARDAGKNAISGAT